MEILIYSNYGTKYEINDNFEIKSNGLLEHSKRWIFDGIANIYGKKVCKAKDIKKFIENNELLYKNGNPKYTMCDIDCGTHRIRGNIKAQGIKSITIK